MVDQDAEEPLMRGDELADEGETDLQRSFGVLEEGQGLGWFIWMLTLSAGISGLLFGSTLVSINDDLSSRLLTTLDKSLITAATSLCALIVSPVSGTLSDRFGRKSILLFSDLFFILGAALQAWTGSVWLMVVGRGIIGFAVGAASFVTPLYIAELAPADSRGRLVTFNVGLITAGQVVAYLIGWAFSAYGGAGGWRWMVGLGGLPALAQGLLLMIMPESPRWLIKIGRAEEARQVLTKVYGQGKGKVVDGVVKGIEIEVREEEDAKRGRLRAMPRKDDQRWFNDTWTELFQVPGHRRALTIACLLQGLQQLCGFNSLMYFSATLFSLLDFSTPTLTSLSVAVTNLVFTMISLVLIDRLGRRKILLLSIPIMVLSLAACAIAFLYIKLPTSPNPSTAPNPTTPTNRSTPLVILASIILYVASYALGLGNVPWQQSELFPLSVRSLGSSLSTATNWACNFIVGITFLPMLEYLSPTVTFAVYAGVCALGWLAILRIYPETSGLGLEEVGDILKSGWGVGRAER